MRSTVIRALVISVVLGGFVSAAGAADQAGSSTATGMPPASPAQSHAAPHPAPARAASSNKAPETVRGAILALDLAAPRPTLKLSVAKVGTKIFELDAKSTPVWIDGKSSTLIQLKPGQMADVRHAMIDGKDTVKSIRVVSAKPIAASTVTPRHTN